MDDIFILLIFLCFLFILMFRKKQTKNKKTFQKNQSKKLNV